MKPKLCPLFILAFMIIVSAAPVIAQPQKDSTAARIGAFDINKVRELSAVNPTLNETSNGASSIQKSGKERFSYPFLVLRIIGSLGIIIVLILCVTWLIRKSGLAGSSRIGGGGSMDVIEVMPLGQNRNMVLVRVLDRVYLCGQTASNIALIDKIEGEAAHEILRSGKGPSSVVQFKDAFNQFISKIKK